MKPAARVALLVVAMLLAPTGLAEERRDSETIGDALNNRAIEVQPNTSIPDAERRARESYRILLQSPGVRPELAAEALRRLGDLEGEAGEATEIEGGADRLSGAAYTEAVSLYKHLLEQHPDFERADRVLYQLARAYESGGDAQQALATLDQLSQRYPNMALADEVLFRRGEILFSMARYHEAERDYSGVVAVGDSSDFYEQALYKRGWSQLKQGRYEEDLQSFLRLLDVWMGGVPAAQVDDYLAGLSRPERELVGDSLRAMSLSLSFLGGRNTLRDLLAQHGQPTYGHLVYLGLSDLYLEQERYSDAADVLVAYVEANPVHARAPYLYREAIAALEKGGFPSLVIKARATYVKNFSFDQPYWQVHSREASEPVVAYLKESVWLVAQNHHALSQDPKTPNRPAESAAAAELYRRYVSDFPQDARAPEAGFLLAEVLYESGDFGAAALAYEATAYNYPAHARSAESAYAGLLAYQKRAEQLQGDAKREWQRRQFAAGLRFVEAYPSHPNGVLVLANVAEGLFALGQLSDAIQAAEKVTAQPNAAAEQRRVAWRVIGHASFDRQDYARAEAAYLEVRRLDEAAGKRDAELSERIAASIYRQGEQARAANRPLEAAAAFKRVGEMVPDASILATAQYDAAQAYLAAGATAEAIPVLQQFRSQYPQSPLAERATASLALAYEKSNDPKAAAVEFERIAEQSRGDPVIRREALTKAANLYIQSKDDAAAARNLKRFVSDYPDSFAESIEAQHKLIEIAERGGDRAAKLEWSKQLVAYDAAGSQRTDRSRYLAAKASLTLAEPARDAFRAAVLKAPLKKSLAEKRRKMEEALTAYGKSAEYGVSEAITASTFEIADLYHGLAKSLYASQRPSNLDADALEQYDLLLEEQAFPLEEKAIEIHEANVRRASEGVYDDAVRKSYSALAELLPARYAKTELEEPYVEAIR